MIASVVRFGGIVVCRRGQIKTEESVTAFHPDEQWLYTPLEFINRRRIEKAQSLLMSGSCTVEQACAAVGFMSTSHFTRLFKRMVGVSPGRYRKGR